MLYFQGLSTGQSTPEVQKRIGQRARDLRCRFKRVLDALRMPYAEAPLFGGDAIAIQGIGNLVVAHTLFPQNAHSRDYGLLHCVANERPI